ncbi:MAG: hypothetical protein WAV40_04285 [Microgenomates group bacterium]
MSETPIVTPTPEPVVISPDSFVQSERRNYFYPILFALLFLVTLGSGIFFFVKAESLSKQLSSIKPSPTPSPIASSDPTSDWHTYTNNEYGFTIKYPLEAKIRTEQLPSNDRMFIFAIDSPNAVFDRMFKSGDYSFGISIQTQKNFPEISDYLNFQKEHNTYKEVIPTIINNVSGYKFGTDGYSTANFHYQGFITKNDDLYITINYFTDQDLKMFDQILSTFKFVDSNTSTTYTCPASGYADCMPGPGAPKPSCTKEAMAWYEANCPTFQGGAL